VIFDKNKRKAGWSGRMQWTKSLVGSDERRAATAGKGT
jgi:hypothetical protein